MDRKQLGWAAAAVGALLVAVSSLADPLGIGEGGGFGWKQTVGTIAGAVLAAVGLWLLYGRGAEQSISGS
jgi:hypothetical protein